MERRNKKVFMLTVTLAFVICLSVSIKFFIIKFDNWRISKSNELALQSEKVFNDKEKLLYLEQIAFLNPVEINLLNAGIQAEKMGLTDFSRGYFLKVKTAKGFYELGNSYYMSEDYQKAKQAYENAISEDNDYLYIFALGKNYLKQGNITGAHNQFEIVAQSSIENKDNNFLLLITELAENSKLAVINKYSLNKTDESLIDNIINKNEDNINYKLLFEALKSQGYPQAAFSFLKLAAQDNILDRDGYLMLAEEYFSRGIYQACYDNLLIAKDLDPYYPQTYQHLIKLERLLNNSGSNSQYEYTYKLITW